MGKPKAQSPQLPKPLGYARMITLRIDDVVASLGGAHHSRAAYWRLVELGPEAAPAVKAGLTDPNPMVRRGCCQFLDLYGDEEAATAMLPLVLGDADAEVRRAAAHALSCKRCANDTWEKRAARRASG